MRWFRERWDRAKAVLRTELSSNLEPSRIFWALFTGVFVGASPFWGFHVLSGVVAGRLLRLNQGLVLFGVGVSNPLFGPPLLATEAALGSWCLGRGFQLPTVDFFGEWEPLLEQGGGLLVDLIVGSLLLGPVLGVIAGGAGVWLAQRWRARRG